MVRYRPGAACQFGSLGLPPNPSQSLMTLAKKNSRPIEVDLRRFRYVISQATAGAGGRFSLNLTVQIESGRGCILRASGLLTRDYWLDFPNIESADNYVVVRPRDVAAVIRRALDSGWNPENAGEPFVHTINPVDFPGGTPIGFKSCQDSWPT